MVGVVLQAAGKTLSLAMLSMLPQVTRLRHIDVRELRIGGVTVRSYSSGKNGFPLVILHGLTGEGCNDSRLVAFCKVLAALGLCVYAPNLPGLCQMDPEPTDLDSITALLKVLIKQHAAGIGLMGFSFGGTYAILASASPETAGAIRFAVAVGAYYSLTDVVEHTFAVRMKQDHSIEEAYALLALDWKYRAMLSLPDGERAALEKLMDRSCSGLMHFTREDADLVAKIMNLQQQEDICREWEKRLPHISSLNIERNPSLASIEAPVFLLHNELDTTVPAEQSRRIEAELTRLRKNVVSHFGRSGEHVTFSIRDDAGLARFFYRIMLLTETPNNATPGRSGRRGTTAA